MDLKELINKVENEQNFLVLSSFYYDNKEFLQALIDTDRKEQLLLHNVSNCAKAEDEPTPLNWLLRDKLGIEKGATYIEPKITVRQCASWISEYVKKYCC